MTASPSTQSLPLTHSYNLARLGNAGDKVAIAVNEAERAAIARWASIVSLQSFEAQIEIAKLAPNRFGLSFLLTADVTQACVVTLEPVKSRLERRFERELQFHGPARHRQPVPDRVRRLFWTARRKGPRRSKACITTWPARSWRNLSCRWSHIPAARVWNFLSKQGAMTGRKAPLPCSRV